MYIMYTYINIYIYILCASTCTCKHILIVIIRVYLCIGAGVPSPNCSNGDDQYPLATCQLGTTRGLALGVYLIIGMYILR